MRQSLLLISIFWLFSLAAEAQTGPGPLRPSTPMPSAELASGSIRGRVVLQDGSPLSEAVRISLFVMRGTQSVSYTDQQGQFEFRGLPPGEYAIEAEGDRQRFEVTRESVQVFRGMPSVVTIALKEKLDSRSTKDAGTISVVELAQIPPKAKSEFERASKASKAGKRTEAIAHLRRAIDIYPNFLMARNDLGAQLLEMDDLDGAEIELKKALNIDPKAFNPNLNLGIVLIKQRNFSQAVNNLDQASAIDSLSPAARFYLGIALIGVENLDRAESELRSAYQIGGHDYSMALFHLGHLYLDKGQRTAAMKSFELYLREAPNAPNSNEVRTLIRMLQ
jgi:Flp pilus assembly protein TadD